MHFIDSNPGHDECACGRGPKMPFYSIWENGDEHLHIMCRPCHREVWQELARTTETPYLAELARETLADMDLAESLPDGGFLVRVNGPTA